MAERALRARIFGAANPKEIQSDENYLPWAFDPDSQQWLSFDGSYSATSPFEKIETARIKREAFETRATKSAEAYGQQLAYESYVRKQVLERDEYLPSVFCRWNIALPCPPQPHRATGGAGYSWRKLVCRRSPQHRATGGRHHDATRLYRHVAKRAKRYPASLWG